MEINSTWYNKKSCSMQGILMKFWIFNMFMHFLFFFSKNNTVGNLEDVETGQIGGRKINDGNFCYPLKCVYAVEHFHNGNFILSTLWCFGLTHDVTKWKFNDFNNGRENSFTMEKIVLKSLEFLNGEMKICKRHGTFSHPIRMVVFPPTR